MFRWTVMIVHLLRMRRNVNRSVFNARKNVSATLSQHMTRGVLLYFPRDRHCSHRAILHVTLITERNRRSQSPAQSKITKYCTHYWRRCTLIWNTFMARTASNNLVLFNVVLLNEGSCIALTIICESEHDMLWGGWIVWTTISISTEPWYMLNNFSNWHLWPWSPPSRDAFSGTRSEQTIYIIPIDIIFKTNKNISLPLQRKKYFCQYFHTHSIF